MRPAEFEYTQASDIQEAVSLLSEAGSSVALAGGQSLIPLLRLGLAQPERLVDIGRLQGLDEIHISEEATSIAALVTVAEIAGSAQLHESNPLWVDAANAIADPLVRNMGTVGGNIAHADPMNDLPPALVASRASVAVRGHRGEREIPADELFAGPFTTTLANDELIIKIVAPKSPAGAYEKLKRAATDYGVAAVAVQLDIDETGLIVGCGVSVSGSPAVAPRLMGAESALVGNRPSTDVIEMAAEAASEQVNTTSDERGSDRYKRAVIRALTRRAVLRAVDRATA